MDDLFRVLVLGIVEGITEFLPVSSTGHLLLCEKWMSVSEEDPFWKMFAVVIQIGAIFAVMVYFRKRILDLFKRSIPLFTIAEPSPVMAVLVGTIPVLGIGFLIHKWVEEHLETPLTIALALGIGGVLMIVIERFGPKPKTESIEKLSWGQAIGVGLIQILAVAFPGTSRSAATIMGGMTLGMTRMAAAEFSFFLAIPAMLAAVRIQRPQMAIENLPHHAPRPTGKAVPAAVHRHGRFVFGGVGGDRGLHELHPQQKLHALCHLPNHPGGGDIHPDGAMRSRAMAWKPLPLFFEQ